MWLVILTVFAVLSKAHGAGAGAARLVCYADNLKTDFAECTHLVYTGGARGEKLDVLLKEYRKINSRTKVLLRVAENDEDLQSLKSKHVQGLEISEAHRSLNRSKIIETLESARSAISSFGGGPLFLSLPAHPELLAKYYDLRALIKVADLMVVETHDLGAVERMTYHPSRLSGMWDMMNTDSVVDLVIGLGVPASKVIISLPATAKQFALINETLSTPGSPSQGSPKVIDQAELCRQLQKGRWTLERDQDLSAPYAFKNKTWIAFEDASSVDVKGKYARVRGLAGLALMRAEQDLDTPCGPTLRTSLAKVLNQQSRAPRAAVLRSLEHEILSAPIHGRALDALQVSPYRITQVVDSDGVIHSIREDTRTEFSCSRQGYFVHPRTCARFYRCVKFDQLSPDYTVFEFDCPAGLAFDSRYEVCVWPGSLPDTQACPGSSEIAPVPRTRFICPDQEGYYADPENCRWFFACLDHGKAPLTAYEFRCPFGLGFDADKLKCDWPWLVPACGNIARYEAEAFGYSGAAIAGASGFHGLTADAINVAAHNSLVSGAAANNLVGIQGGVLSAADALDANFITSQEYNHDALHQGVGLAQPTDYANEEKYTSGSLILDDYRLPKSKGVVAGKYAISNSDNSGAYVHDPTGDQAEPYRHENSPVVPYIHDKHPYNEYQDYGLYVDSGKYGKDNSGAYYGEEYRSDYSDYKADYSGSYKADNSGAHVEKNGNYVAGVYKASGNNGLYATNDGVAAQNGQSTSSYNQYQGSYSSGNADTYLTDSKVFTGASHTLAAGAVNVGLVGKTKLVDTGYIENNYQANGYADSYTQNGHVSFVSQPAVSIHHVGTDSHNLDGYSVVTTPTTSGIPTTATPFDVTTALPAVTSYRTFVPEQPKTNIKQIFGLHQEVTYAQPTYVPIQVTPKVEVVDYNQAVNYKTSVSKSSDSVNVKSQGYDYPKPSVKFEDGVTYTTPAPIEVSTFTPRGFSHETVHKSGIDYQYPNQLEVIEEPFKKVVAYTTGPSYTSDASLNTYQDSYSHQTIHKTELGTGYQQNEAVGYEYKKPEISFEEPKIVVEYTTAQPIITSTIKPNVYSHQTFHKVDESRVNHYNVNNGYEYPNPQIRYEEAVVSAQPIVTETVKPQVYSQQIFHKVEKANTDFEYAQPEIKYQQVVPVQTVPQVFSQQTYHKVDESRDNYDATFTGYEYTKPEIKYEEAVQPVISVQPVVTSTSRPQVYSQQTFHKVDEARVNYDATFTGYEYIKPEIKYEEAVQPVVTSTTRPQVYSQQTFHKVDESRVNNYDATFTGYEYTKPEIKYEEAVQPVVSVQPVVTSTYRPQVYSQQTFHKVDENHVNNYDTSNGGYQYLKPEIKYEEPKIVEYTTPQPIVTSTYAPQVYSQQTIHKVDHSNVNYEETGYSYPKPEIKYEQPEVVVEYTTAKPVQPIVTSTYTPQVYSQQTFHKVDNSKINTYDVTKTGYEYSKPQVQFVETAQPTYQPQTYSQQTIHKVESYTPQVQQAVTLYQNPILEYKQKATPITYVKPVQTHHSVQHESIKQITKPIQYENQYSNQNVLLNQGYTYSQPEIQRNIETFNSGPSYSLASKVSHQVFHQSNENIYQENKNVYVSSTPAPIAYEEHYTEYEAPKKYKAPEYVPPKVVYQESYEAPTQAPYAQQEYIQTQDQYDYKGVNYAEQYDIVQKTVPAQQVSFSTSHVQQPKKIESYHISSYPGASVTTTYAPVSYESPEIQVGYQAEEYLPPVSTPKPITTTYSPSTYSTTTREYLPPSPTPEYLPPKVENDYLPPSTTAKPIVKINFKPTEYLPPKVETTYLPSSTPKTIVDFKYEYEPPKVQSTYLPPTTTEKVYEAPDYLPPKVESTYLPPSTTKRPKTPTTTYKYVESTTEYKAPEYLPPQDYEQQEDISETFGLRNKGFDYKIQNNQEYVELSSTVAPIKRKQNIVVQTAKNNLLGFGTVGPDAGLVSEYYSSSTSIPTTEAYTATPKVVTSTYAPVSQGIVEVTPKPIPVRRVKPKVAVVTKINDFNPLLVRKLGAVCSCQSPIVVLRGTRPNGDAEYDDYSDDYIESGRGDISGYEQRKSQRLQAARAKFATATSVSVPVSTTTFNPIIVPDDSYYQDYQETELKVDESPQVVSTPVYSTTEKVVRIRPRVKAVTVAPTYKSLLSEVSSTPVSVKSDEISAVNSQTFDRYGPGGWRSRDETLQGSIDCQRAGLFRHPKQCNKFYACRWDCTKQRFTLHVFNCPVQLSFDPNIGACNWPSQGPACQGDTLLSNNV